jgi:hypothetical protein
MNCPIPRLQDLNLNAVQVAELKDREDCSEALQVSEVRTWMHIIRLPKCE